MNKQQKDKLLNQIESKDDKILFANILDKLDNLDYCNYYSDFLDPVRCAKFVSILKTLKGINTNVFGGYENAERLILCVSLDNEIKYPISMVSIKFNDKFNKAPSHRDYLGALVGMGIERCLIGDIVICEKETIIILKEEIKDYILSNLSKVGNVPVKLSESSGLIEGIKVNKKEKRLTVASLRIDAIISAVFSISRSNAESLISSEKVFINWEIAKSSSKNVCPNDIISVRGEGKIQIQDVIGTTKKGRLSIVVLVY